ncbi:MAG: NADH-quinone oxidoreductase subunit C [Acidobacteriota bacterium]
MNEPNGLKSIVADLERTFGPKIRRLSDRVRAEVYLETDRESIADIASHLYRLRRIRLAMVFGIDDREEQGIFHLQYTFACDRAGGFILIRVPVPASAPEFPSLTPLIPAVNWQEREIQDWFGLKPVGHPNPRRVALHDDFPDALHPLRKDFDLFSQPQNLPRDRHVFRPVEGEGVFQVPVGPIHAGIIEPGHFRFSVAGEPVLYLQIRLFYTHKATEKLFEQMPISQAVFLAESISGDSSFSHSTAFCQAVERLVEFEVPRRARLMRTVLLELERLYNHIADIGAIATDVGFMVASAHAMRLKEQLLCLNALLTGSRLLRGMNVCGGVRRDWGSEEIQEAKTALRSVKEELTLLVDLILSSASTRDRLETTGVLSHKTAVDLGVVGVAARASGVDIDVRRDFPYAAYDEIPPKPVLCRNGDVLDRMQVRMGEADDSIRIALEALALLPAGAVKKELPPLPPNRCALGYVEGWRGEILHWVLTGRNGTLTRCKIKDPSLNNWPALPEAVQGNIIPDFPVINKSFNLSYSGTDR